MGTVVGDRHSPVLLGAPKGGEISDNHEGDEALVVVADSAYGSGPTGQALKEAGVDVLAKAPPDRNPHGGFPKSAFDIDIEAKLATCPAGVTTTTVTTRSNGITWLKFPADACNACALKERYTSSSNGRSITLGPHEALLAQARVFQHTDEFKAVYNSKRPTV